MKEKLIIIPLAFHAIFMVAPLLCAITSTVLVLDLLSMASADTYRDPWIDSIPTYALFPIMVWSLWTPLSLAYLLGRKETEA